ncbi:hypothetical protein [Variovorax arabinosiphilus]|uniref:hypothetical protein n=1 Tax=Variovorax arabinosiphilus TaxID=3053498 RepID=UPI0025761D46|nr:MULTISPECIES: hypothetical protein [unclassified Variovorax]MDM0129337.1 hypothetical protein [Variovorax sp. J2L1-63]MDM0232876.1 hypothetical protein [Variovorax sp. J2R1-6]
MTEELAYPALSTIPAYTVELEKLSRFQTELNKAEESLVQMRADWFRAQEIEAHQPGVVLIEHAEMLLDGRVPSSLNEKTRAAEMLISGLRRAIGAQQVVVDRVAFELSQKAAQRFSEEHKARTKRIKDAIVELHAANQAEISLRHSIDALGYSQQLPCTRFEYPDAGSFDPFDITGGYVPAWHADIADYLMTAEERDAIKQRIDTAARRKKVATLTA